jgi:uncharacterized protein (TIGR04255 family)
LEKELPKDISKVARANFPIEEPKPAFTQQLLISKKELTARRQEFTEWNFYGLNREKYLRIVPQAFFVLYKDYENYENLRSGFLAIVESFFNYFEQAQPSRLGLRYINEFDVPASSPLNWQEYISRELLGLFSYTIEEAVPSRVFHNFEAVFSAFNLRFQFGVHNPDYPAPIRRRAFILDYDAYFRGLLERKDIPECLDKYHIAIQKVFERSITGRLRKVMNESK